MLYVLASFAVISTDSRGNAAQFMNRCVLHVYISSVPSVVTFLRHLQDRRVHQAVPVILHGQKRRYDTTLLNVRAAIKAMALSQEITLIDINQLSISIDSTSDLVV